MGFSQNQTNPQWLGLSWVAVWTMLFTVVVPTSPKRTLISALLSVSAVPVVVAIAGTRYLAPSPIPQLFFGFTLPYLLVVLMAYVGSHVVYGLGKEVSRARELGSYVLVDRIGQGGMGEVWRAKHRLLARPAAIKLIRPALTSAEGSELSAEVRRRFELEAQTISSLRSPHTVNLYDFGVADDGAFYYVMELLDGLDADSLVRRAGAMPPERVIAILRQVCHSLSEAEANGLVHRDIKPANIFLCRYGEDFDFVKVLDFGIVKAVDNNSSDTRLSLMTSENVVRGTPSFIAPEQALGSATIDGRADIYSLGCVAYWLLTGELVFTAETQMGLLIHHAHTLPTPPSQRTNRPIPPALEELIMACLAKDPGLRPQSARELSDRLARIALPDEWTPERAKQWWDVSGPVPAHVVKTPATNGRAKPELLPSSVYMSEHDMSPQKTDVPYGTLDLLILKTLDTMGPMHGYSLARRIEQVSETVVRLSQGSIYPAVIRLEQQGWIRTEWGVSETNRKVKVYRLTAAGTRQLHLKVSEWEETIALVARFLEAKP